MPGHRSQKSLGSSRDLQATGPNLSVGTSRIDKHADDGPLCLQKIDDLRLGRDRRSTSVRPDGEVEPGRRLLQGARLRSIVTHGNGHDVARKVTESADAVQFVS